MRLYNHWNWTLELNPRNNVTDATEKINPIILPALAAFQVLSLSLLNHYEFP